jgi:hypothetical protein
MKKLYIDAIEFLRMCESGRLAWPFAHAVEFIKSCRIAGARTWRISQPEHGRYLIVRIPVYPVWIDNCLE